MVFGLFSRKSTLDTSASDDVTRLPTPTPSISSTAHHSPFRFPTVLRSALAGSTTDLTLNRDSDRASFAEGVNHGHSPAPPPPVTPTPPPTADPNETKLLYDLVLTIPPKTLHAFTLTRLRPQPTSSALESHPDNTLCPPSPDTLTKLTSFFSTLEPPPLIHCVRCHKDFYDIENEEKDKACRVPHDDESTVVLRTSIGYETLWGCCGQTASGDGSEGPPDGWCYEGKHTTDIKRARFRADSTLHNDKLTTCLKLNCHGIRDRLPRHDPHASPSRNVGTSSARKSNPSPARSQASVVFPRSVRKRPRESLKEVSGSENEADAESVAGKAKDKERVGGSTGKKGDAANMAINDTNLPPKSKARPKSKPISRARAPSNPTPATKTKTTTRTVLSQSHTQVISDSEASTHSRPRTRSHVRDESRGRTASKLTRAGIHERAVRAKKAIKPLSRSPTPEGVCEAETDECRESDREERGRDRKKRRVGRG